MEKNINFGNNIIQENDQEKNEEEFESSLSQISYRYFISFEFNFSYPPSFLLLQHFNFCNKFLISLLALCQVEIWSLLLKVLSRTPPSKRKVVRIFKSSIKYISS